MKIKLPNNLITNGNMDDYNARINTINQFEKDASKRLKDLYNDKSASLNFNDSTYRSLNDTSKEIEDELKVIEALYFNYKPQAKKSVLHSLRIWVKYQFYKVNPIPSTDDDEGEPGRFGINIIEIAQTWNDYPYSDASIWCCDARPPRNGEHLWRVWHQGNGSFWNSNMRYNQSEVVHPGDYGTPNVWHIWEGTISQVTGEISYPDDAFLGEPHIFDYRYIDSRFNIGNMCGDEFLGSNWARAMDLQGIRSSYGRDTWNDFNRKFTDVVGRPFPVGDTLTLTKKYFFYTYENYT